MSEKEKQPDNDPERTLMTLDQLSQTIEVMSSVVNRLRQHLSEQLRAQAVRAQLSSSGGPSGTSDSSQTSEHRLNRNIQRSSLTQIPKFCKAHRAKNRLRRAIGSHLVVEIRQAGRLIDPQVRQTLHRATQASLPLAMKGSMPPVFGT